MDPVKSSKRFLERCTKAFDKTPGYPLADQVLTEAFKSHPRNHSVHSVLLKVALLNSLYRTQIFDVYGMAEHVLDETLDKYLRKGSLEAVSRIRRGHAIRRKKGKELDFYSFATKYCHWHRPDVYPMYDWYVNVALRRLNCRLTFSPRFGAEALRDYPFFKDTVDACRASLNCNRLDYKRFDQALWILGQLLEGEADGAIVRAVGKMPQRL